MQNAFRDVEDALVDRSRTQEQLFAQQNQLNALRVYERLARMRYNEGVTSYLEVLDAQRSLFSTELDFAQTRGRLSKFVVSVYRSMASGWLDQAAAAAYQPADPAEPRPKERIEATSREAPQLKNRSSSGTPRSTDTDVGPRLSWQRSESLYGSVPCNDAW